MDFSAKHVDFVLACYGISAFLLVAMVLIIIVRARAADRQLAKLEARREKSTSKARREPAYREPA